MYIYIQRERERQTDRQTDRQTQRERERERDCKQSVRSQSLYFCSSSFSHLVFWNRCVNCVFTHVQLLRINPRERRQPKIWELLCQLVVFLRFLSVLYIIYITSFRFWVLTTLQQKIEGSWSTKLWFDSTKPVQDVCPNPSPTMPKTERVSTVFKFGIFSL